MGAENSGRDVILSRLHEASIPAPRLGMVLGSGLHGAAPGLEDVVEIAFADIPGWPQGRVPGHAGVLCSGRLGENGVLVQMGRPHYYEGLDLQEVTFPVRLMAALGVEKIFFSNAAGGLNPVFERGHLMLVRDHINLMGENPLRGLRDEQGNPAFLDVSNLYNDKISDTLMERARTSAWPMEEGVLVAVSGPTYETGAELRYLRLVGGDAVSMSLVPEALVAHYLGLEVAAVSVITNVWDLRRPHTVSHEEVLHIAAEAAPILREIIAVWLDLALHKA